MTAPAVKPELSIEEFRTIVQRVRDDLKTLSDACAAHDDWTLIGFIVTDRPCDREWQNANAGRASALAVHANSDVLMECVLKLVERTGAGTMVQVPLAALPAALKAAVRPQAPPGRPVS
jgi:hypothetical protein